MNLVEPHVRTAGHGRQSVVLLHASGASGRQWNTLIDSLQSRFRLHAVDLHGHGGTAAWPGPAPLRLEDDAALVEPLLAAAPDGVHLVGHSIPDLGHMGPLTHAAEVAERLAIFLKTQALRVELLASMPESEPQAMAALRASALGGWLASARLVSGNVTGDALRRDAVAPEAKEFER